MSKTINTFGQLNLLGALDETPLDENILLNDDPNLDTFITDWSKARFYALDIETMGSKALNEALDPFRGKIRLIQIGLQDGRIAVIDLTKPVSDRFTDVLESTLLNPNQHPIGHNIQFDLAFIKQQLGFECRSPRCTRILSILLWCGIKNYNHGLKDVYKRLFNEDLSKEEQRSDWSQPNLSNSQINYAANDVRATFRCFLEICSRLRQWDDVPDIRGLSCRYKLTDIAKVECDVIPAFVEMILVGQPIDIQYGERVRQQYLDAIEDLYQPVYDALALSFSAASDKLCKAVWEKLDILLVQEVRDEDDDKDDIIDFEQMSLFATKPMVVPKGKKLSTSAANIFFYYTQTKNDLLLRISLARSLKKSVDSIDALLASAKQNDGYAKGSYTSLGSTGSGRSTCSGGGRSSIEATNLQNIAGEIEHPLVEAYKLPPVRSIIRAKGNKNLWLQDLSSSHVRFGASNSGDRAIVDILQLKDPHAYVTSKMFTVAGKEASVEYCIANKKTDPLVKYFRSIAKCATYSMFNDASPGSYKQSLNKAFVDVSMEDCEKAQEALKEAFPGYSAYATRLKYLARKAYTKLDCGEFAQFRTHDGRLFHVKVWERVSRSGDRYKAVKLGEVTSVQLISPEAIVMKKALINILEFIRANRHLPIKLNSFTHDDCSGEDYTQDKVLAKFVYKTISHYFTEALDVESGLDEHDAEGYRSILIDSYADK